VRTALARLRRPRARAVTAALVGLALLVGLGLPFGDWQANVPLVVTAAGILVVVLVGAVGEIAAGVVVGAIGWALNWYALDPIWWKQLVALPAWLAVGGVAGWLAMRLRRRSAEREDELADVNERYRDADTRYRSLAQVVPVAAYVRPVEADGSPSFLGPQIDQLAGYAANAFRRDPELFLRLVHADDRERVRSEVARAVEQREPLRTEYRMLARDGRVVWVQDEAVTVLDAQGEPLCVQGYLLDISERKTADDDRKQLRTAESAANATALERQQTADFIGKAAALLASSLDYRATIREVAALAVRRLADWCVVDRLGEDATLTRIAAERAEAAHPGGDGGPPPVNVLEVIQRRRPELTSSHIVVPLVSHGGRTLGALSLFAGERRRPFESDDLSWASALAGMAALAIDTARMHEEVEARAEAARVLSYVGDGVFLLDRSGTIRLWNPMAEAITTLSAESVIGRAATDAIPGWDQIAERVPIGPARQPGAAEALPLETERGERWISISGVEFFGGTVYAFRDITDAHRLDELQAEFISTASHELRTPLAAVYGAAQTLRRHDFALDEAGRERFISLIVDESERLGRIVNQILLANQLDVGRLDLVEEPFDAHELLERVSEATRTHIPPHIDLELNVADAIPPVAADKDRVRQILVNLVENAIKYSPDGGTIELGVEAIDGMVLFRVVDEGLGIPDEERGRVFEKFYRLDPDMTRGIGGTGLGLYICSELVERMGGRIWVESRDERGSAFYFELPAVGPARLPARTREPSGIERTGT
jgi:PAS domain S-box-containing protein